MGVLSLLLGSLTGVNPADSKTPPPPAAPTISAPAVAASPPPLSRPTTSTPAPRTQTPPLTPHQTPPPPAPPTDYYTHYISQRSFRQLGLFFAGTGFFYLSVMITRRAVARHKLAARLKFYEANHQFAGWGRSVQQETADSMLPKKDPLVAVEALNLATLNTLAFAIAAAGGLSWGLDISTLEDLRRYARRSIVLAGAEGAPDEVAEREVAEWVAKTFGIEERKGSAGDGGVGNGEGVEGAEGEKGVLEKEKKK
ncbi:hypothetical protein C8A01DRAFT_32045 [Parachaetomium inaequale]|uniref:Altered inheritance of mitochondria protein 11 n=1 Tax=Parachaetomium inaequale TaxID=2588326 RepID=A0AAN6PMU3_9PEZI|nr:hypothetical protein C8A01DRAFT_32045 [Parachaetomium inaequale]